MSDGAGSCGSTVLNLHMWVFAIVVAVALVAVGAMLVSVIRHRRARDGASPRTRRAAALELVWIVLPIVILIALAYPAMRLMLDRHEPPGASQRSDPVRHEDRHGE